MQKEKIIETIKKIVRFSPRIFKNEIKTRKFIEEKLRKNDISYQLQFFKTTLPFYKKFSLCLDDIKIKCKPTCFKSGKIEEKALISSLHVREEFKEANINFNPYCRSLSLPTFYYAPSLAISRKDISKVLKAKNVIGKVKVSKKTYTTANLLVGNLKNPNSIYFTHYDCIERGVIDNAVGVALILNLILMKKDFLKQNLFVFSACEEISYDEVYWGYGFRVFEEEFKSLLNNAKKIIVIDSVGQTNANIIKGDEELVKEAFPIKNLKRFSKKISLIIGDIQELMKIYHSELDNLSAIKLNVLYDTNTKLLKFLK